jgi:hypothetical protein
MNSRCLARQSVHAGIAINTPLLSAVAARNEQRSRVERHQAQHLLMSHQTGATSLTLPRHTIVPTDAARQCSKIQNDNAIVATFPARIWRGRGISTSPAAINPAIVYEGKTVIILLRELRGNMRGVKGRARARARLPVPQDLGLSVTLPDAD